MTEQAADLHARVVRHRDKRQGLHEEVEVHRDEMQRIEQDITALEKSWQLASAQAVAAEEQVRLLHQRLHAAEEEIRGLERHRADKQQACTGAQVALCQDGRTPDRPAGAPSATHPRSAPGPAGT